MSDKRKTGENVGPLWKKTGYLVPWDVTESHKDRGWNGPLGII